MKNNKFYIILGYNALDESYCGLAEYSFSMGIDDERVLLYSVSKGDFPWKFRDFPERKRIAKEYLKENGGRNASFAQDYIPDAYMNPNSPNQWIWFYLRDIADNLNKKHYNNCYWQVFRVNSKNCPVDIDMKEYYKILHNKRYRKSLTKYEIRNIRFTKRDPLLVGFMSNL